MSSLTIAYLDVVTSTQGSSGIGTHDYHAQYLGKCVWRSPTVAVLWEFFQTSPLPGRWEIEMVAPGEADLYLAVAFNPITEPTNFTRSLRWTTSGWSGSDPTRFLFDENMAGPPSLIFPPVLPVFP